MVESGTPTDPMKPRFHFGKLPWQRVAYPGQAWHGHVALGNGTMRMIHAVFYGIPRTSSWVLMVAIEGYGAYTFNHSVDGRYIKEKLGTMNDWDALNIADWINVQLGLDGTSDCMEPHGHYREEFMGKS